MIGNTTTLEMIGKREMGRHLSGLGYHYDIGCTIRRVKQTQIYINL